MKKTIFVLIALLMVLSLAACGSTKPEHTLTYVDGSRITLFDEYDCVAVFTKYTNGSSESSVPADNLTVKAYQNGVELSPIVPTGDKTDGYVQCDASVQSGVTAAVVWIFQLDDESPVSVEIPGGEKVEIDISSK